MAIRHFGLAAVTALGGLVACASIAGLDSSDPVTSGPNGTSPPNGDGDGGTFVTEAGVSISPEKIALTGVTCGLSKTSSIVIKNAGTEPAPYSVTLPDNTVFALEGADGGTVTGDVAPNDTKVINVTGTSAAPGSESTDIVVTAGDTVHQIPTTLETRGAGLVITPTTLDFGEVRQNTDSAPITVIFQNTGNDPITISSFSDAPGFESPKNLAIKGGEQATGEFKLLNGPADKDVKSFTITPTLDPSTVLCGPTPTLTLKGQRTDQTVIVNPPTLDFGRVGCGALSAVKPKLTITNASNKPIAYTIALTAGSNSLFAADQPLSGNIVKPQDAAHPLSTEITFSQRNPQTDLKNVDETLTIDITGNDPPAIPQKTIKLHADVYGAILVTTTGGFRSGYYTYPDLVNIDDNSTGVGTITNIGNATVCVKYSMSGGSTNVFAAEADDRLAPNVVNDLSVYFDASSNNTYTSSVAIAHNDCNALGGGESAPFCKPPANVAVSGYRNVQQSSSGSNGGYCRNPYFCH